MARIFNKKNWIISQLRRTTFRYPPFIKAKNKAKTTYYILSKKGKQLKRVSYTCAKCGISNLKEKEKQMDHIIPICGPMGFIDWNSYLEGHYCDEENFQCLCIPCHKIKSDLENSIRKDNKVINISPNFRKNRK